MTKGVTKGVAVGSPRPWPRIASAVITFIALETLVVAQFVLSYRDGLMTHNQMESRGLGNGLPLIWHFGVWSDGLMLSGLLTWIVFKYIPVWTARRFIPASVVAAVITFVMTRSYLASDTPEGHVVDHALTPAGKAHAAYMWIALTIVLVYFLDTPSALSRDKAIVSWLLLGHVFVGTHMLLGLLNDGHALAWYQRTPLSSF